MLFIILFLHQTTTYACQKRSFVRCLSSCSYIKPQHGQGSLANLGSCLSSCSYIKPQLAVNWCNNALSCLSSCSYIKPQHSQCKTCGRCVVYHLVPTSNHNYDINFIPLEELFIILFLHQTTTKDAHDRKDYELFIILFLHQTTTPSR